MKSKVNYTPVEQYKLKENKYKDEKGTCQK